MFRVTDACIDDHEWSTTGTTSPWSGEDLGLLNDPMWGPPPPYSECVDDMEDADNRLLMLLETIARLLVEILESMPVYHRYSPRFQPAINRIGMEYELIWQYTGRLDYYYDIWV